MEHLKLNENNIGIQMAQLRPLIIEEVLTNPSLQQIELYVVCPFYSPALSLPFLIFSLRSEKTRRLSIEAIK